MDWGNPLIYVIGGSAVIAAIWKLGQWKGGMDRFGSSLEDTLKTIQSDIKKIFERLPPPVTSTQSPVKLTDFGRSISNDLDAGKWAEEKAAGLIDGVRNKQPYEIQEFCFKFANDEEYDPTMVSKIQTSSAYNHGIDIDQIKRVLAIELRDVFLRVLDLEPPK